jgi:hypothetical protein
MFSSYVVMISNIIDSYPSNIEEVVEKKELRDSMMEYQSIMKNDV